MRSGRSRLEIELLIRWRTGSIDRDGRAESERFESERTLGFPVVTFPFQKRLPRIFPPGSPLRPSWPARRPAPPRALGVATGDPFEISWAIRCAHSARTSPDEPQRRIHKPVHSLSTFTGGAPPVRIEGRARSGRSPPLDHRPQLDPSRSHPLAWSQRPWSQAPPLPPTHLPPTSDGPRPPGGDRGPSAARSGPRKALRL